jgi:hypothetical protein
MKMANGMLGSWTIANFPVPEFLKNRPNAVGVHAIFSMAGVYPHEVIPTPLADRGTGSRRRPATGAWPLADGPLKSPSGPSG